MIDLDELDRLAKAAQANSDDIGEQEWYEADEIASLMHGLIAKADAGLMSGCTPPIILALIAEARALREYREMARKQVYELMGVIVDIEQFGSEFDDACMNTIKRVRDQLHGIAGTKPCV